MKKSFDTNPELKKYFEQLPKIVQESVMQSSIQFSNKKDLQQFVENIVESNG